MPDAAATPLLSPTGWGDPSRRTGLPDHAAAWLRDTLGAARQAVPTGPVAVRPSGATSDLVAALSAVAGPEHVRVDDNARRERAAGRSYLDLLALRGGTAVSAPDVVVLPGSAAEVAAVLAGCSTAGAAVVPFGGGTSVVGGLRPDGAGRPVVSLDLRRLDRLLAVDAESLTATFEPGVRGPAAEALLSAHGLTLGHFPQSFEYATLGGYAATRSAGQASTGYGRFDELVTALTVQTPAGELRLGRGAASAAGPDLLGLLLGSEGAFGVVSSVTVRVRKIPAHRRFEAVFFRTWSDGCAALRELEQEGVAPVVARLSDPDETAVQLALAGRGGAKGLLGRAVLRARGYGDGCLAIFSWEGTEATVAARRKASLDVARRHGAFAVGTSAGERWAHGRYAGPYLRDDLLDAGYLVETLETSATWSMLASTRQAVRTALLGALAPERTVVMCHVSHLYPHGASLYFTVLTRRSTTDPVGQWQRAKDAASAAIVASGATITHHHAVGTDHREHLLDEIGPLGVEVLRAVKATLDPTGILNPGTLIPTVVPSPEA